MRRFKKYLLLSQVSFDGLLLICCFIIPSVVVHNGGISNFGNHRSTVVLYSLAFFLSMVFQSMAAMILITQRVKLWRPALLLLGLSLLELLVFISTFPRHISYGYAELHDYIGIALFMYDLTLSIWFVLKLKNTWTLSLFMVELAGDIIGLLSIIKTIHFLFVGQFLGMAGFGVLFVICLPKLINKQKLV